MMTRLFLALLFSVWSPAPAAVATQPGAEHAPLFEAAAQEVDVPAELTQAIARVESGGAPYALNVEGRGYFFDNKVDAVAAAEKAAAAGRSFDSGMMQINNWWLKRYGIPLEAVFDPAANILLGSWILRQELDRQGDTWKAVARYHSPNSDRGQHYASLVRRALEKGPVQTVATPSQQGSQVNTKEKITRPPATDTPMLKASSPLVVYRVSSKPVFNRVTAEQAEPGPDPEQRHEQSGLATNQELMADNNQDQAMGNERVFVRRFQ